MTRKMGVLAMVLATTLPLIAQEKSSKRLAESTAVLKTIVTEQGLPPSLLAKAECVLVYPSVRKVGVGIGVTYGRGVIACRTGAEMNGKWSAPAMYTLDTGSLGVQLGSTSTDYVLLVMTQRGANKVLSGKLKLGADASAAAASSWYWASSRGVPYFSSKSLKTGSLVRSSAIILRPSFSGR